MVLGNPWYPAISGPDVLPLTNALVPVDPGTRWDFEYHTYSASTPDQQMGTWFDNPPESPRIHYYVNELWVPGNELIQTKVKRYVFAPHKVTLGADATQPGGTVADLDSVDNTAVIIMDTSGPDAYFEVFFNCGALDAGSERVVNVSLQYRAWSDDLEGAPPGKGLTVSWGASAFSQDPYGAWLVAANSQTNSPVQTKSLGEIDASPSTTSEGGNQFVWTTDSLEKMNAGTETRRFEFFANSLNTADPLADIYVKVGYVALIVETIPEYRTGVGVGIIDTSGSTPVPSNAELIQFSDPFIGSSYPVATSTTGPWVASVRGADPASPSDLWPAAFAAGVVPAISNITRMDGRGPWPQITGLRVQRDTMDAQVSLRRTVVSRGQPAGDPDSNSVDIDDLMLGVYVGPLTGGGSTGPFFPAYQGVYEQSSIAIYSGNNSVQELVLAGGTTYDAVRLVVRVDPRATASLLIEVRQPVGTVLASATITVAQVLALPDVGDGWRVLEKKLSTSVTPAVSPTSSCTIRASSSTGQDFPWWVNAALPISVGGSHNGYNPNGTGAEDFGMALAQTFAAPSAPTATVSTAANDASCAGSSMSYAHVTWTGSSAVYLYGIQRAIGPAFAWETIDYVENFGGSMIYDDKNMPWDVNVRYRLLAFREADLLVSAASAASAIITSASDDAVIGFTDGTTQVVYAPVQDA